MAVLLWEWITLLGIPELWLLIAGILVAAYGALGKTARAPVRQFLAVFVVSLLLVFVTVQLLKDLTQVPRPCAGLEGCETSFSFPSGHAASIFVFFSSLLIFLPRPWLLLLVIPLLVALSRVALGVHTWADVLAGAAIGWAIPFGVRELLKGFLETDTKKRA